MSTLRHTTATLLLRAGVDLHRVQRILRHKDVKLTTDTYGHLQVEDLRAAINTLPALAADEVAASTGQHQDVLGFRLGRGGRLSKSEDNADNSQKGFHRTFSTMIRGKRRRDHQ